MREFVIGVMVGMSGCAALFNYAFWLEDRRKEAVQFLKTRVMGL